MRFKMEGDMVDMSSLRDGTKISIKELEELLFRNHRPGSPLFW